MAGELPLELGMAGLYEVKLAIGIGQRHVLRRLDRLNRRSGIGNVHLRRRCGVQHRGGSRHGGVEMLDADVPTPLIEGCWSSCCMVRAATIRAGMMAPGGVGTGLVRLLPGRSTRIERGGMAGRRSCARRHGVVKTLEKQTHGRYSTGTVPNKRQRRGHALALLLACSATWRGSHTGSWALGPCSHPPQSGRACAEHRLHDGVP